MILIDSSIITKVTLMILDMPRLSIARLNLNWNWGCKKLDDEDDGDGDGDGDGVMFVVAVMFVILVVMAMGVLVVIIVHLSRFCSKTFAEEQLVLIKQHLCFIFETINHDNKVVKDDDWEKTTMMNCTCCLSY